MTNNQYQLNIFIPLKLSSRYKLVLKNLLNASSILIVYSLFTYNIALAAAEIREYGIAILPDAECVKIAEELNAEIIKRLGKVENIKNSPHLNLYQAAYAQQDLPAIYSQLQQLTLRPFNFSVANLTSMLDRWIDLEIEKTDELQRLHEAAIKLASPYHKGMLQRASDMYSKLPAGRRKQIDEYGVGGVLKSYKPTITLFYQYPPVVKLKSIAKEAANNLPQKQLVCKVDKLVLGEIGYNGNMEKIIYSINIPN